MVYEQDSRENDAIKADMINIRILISTSELHISLCYFWKLNLKPYAIGTIGNEGRRGYGYGYGYGYDAETRNTHLDDSSALTLMWISDLCYPMIDLFGFEPGVILYYILSDLLGVYYTRMQIYFATDIHFYGHIHYF